MSEPTLPAADGRALSEGLGRSRLAALEELTEPFVHILSDDLEIMELSETTAVAASVAFSTPNRGRSEPLVRLRSASVLASLPPQWLPMTAAPHDDTVLLRVPTRWAKRHAELISAGYWEDGGFWVIFNADEAVQKVEPTGWMRLPESA